MPEMRFPGVISGQILPSNVDLTSPLASPSSLASPGLASPETMRDHIFSGGPDVVDGSGGVDNFNLRTNFGLEEVGFVMMRRGKKSRGPGK